MFLWKLLFLFIGRQEAKVPHWSRLITSLMRNKKAKSFLTPIALANKVAGTTWPLCSLTVKNSRAAPLRRYPEPLWGPAMNCHHWSLSRWFTSRWGGGDRKEGWHFEKRCSSQNYLKAQRPGQDHQSASLVLSAENMWDFVPFSGCRDAVSHLLCCSAAAAAARQHFFDWQISSSLQFGFSVGFRKKSFKLAAWWNGKVYFCTCSVLFV